MVGEIRETRSRSPTKRYARTDADHETTVSRTLPVVNLIDHETSPERVRDLFWGSHGNGRGARAPTFMLILVDQRPTMPDETDGKRSLIEISVTEKGPNLLDERVRKRKKVKKNQCLARPTGCIHSTHCDAADPFLGMTSLLSSQRFRYDRLKVI